MDLAEAESAVATFNTVTHDLSPSIDRVWSDTEDWETVNQKININLDTTMIFDIGADADFEIAPSDEGGLKNGAGLDPLVVNVVEANQYVTTRSRTAFTVTIPSNNGAVPPVPTAEGSKFYLSFKTTADSKYWTIEFTFQRPVVFTNEIEWKNEVEDRFRNYELFEYDKTNQHLAKDKGTVVSFVVNEVTLKKGGVFAVSLSDADEINVLTSDLLPSDANEASPFSILSTTTKIGYAWKLPTDANMGTVYTVGLTAKVNSIAYSGIWKITAVDTPMLCETTQQFFGTIPNGAHSFKFTTMGTALDGFDSDLSYGSQLVAHKVDLWVGQGFSVEIAVDGVRAETANPRTIANQFGVFLNRVNYVLELYSEVSTKTTTEDVVSWSSLASDATKEVYPSFAWVVP